MPATQSLADSATSIGGHKARAQGPYLTLAFRGDAVAESARFDLAGVSRVEIGRADAFAVVETGDQLRIELADAAMSERHALLARDGGTWTAVDQGSKNGTLVNRSAADGRPLGDGALIEAGRSYFFLRQGSAGSEHSDRCLRGRELTARAMAFATFHPGLERSLDRLARVCDSSIPVLIHGETGTGKELVARAVHDRSGRAGDFVGVNCGAIPETLVEGELFGAAKGSFSGAHSNRLGLVRAADRGTLFLDEVAELSPASQVALLRVLQEHEVLPLGHTSPVAVDIRVVAATHQNLRELCARGRFRDDLFARLGGYVFTVPPLRLRMEDLGILISTFLDEVGAGQATLSRRAARALLAHDWPLNIRELRNAVTSASVIADGAVIRLEHLSIDSALARATNADNAGDGSGPAKPLEDRLRGLLDAHRGNISAVARELRTSRSQVKRLLKRFAITQDPHS